MRLPDLLHLAHIPAGIRKIRQCLHGIIKRRHLGFHHTHNLVLAMRLAIVEAFIRLVHHVLYAPAVTVRCHADGNSNANAVLLVGYNRPLNFLSNAVGDKDCLVLLRI